MWFQLQVFLVVLIDVGLAFVVLVGVLYNYVTVMCLMPALAVPTFLLRAVPRVFECEAVLKIPVELVSSSLFLTDQTMMSIRWTVFPRFGESEQIFFLFWIDPEVSESEDNLSFRFESGPPQLFVRDTPLLDQFRSMSNFASVVPRYVEQKHSLAETSILKDVDPLFLLPTVLVLLLVDLRVVETGVVISFVSERFGTKLKFQRLVCSVIDLHLAFGHLKQQETQTVWFASIFR